MDNKIEHNLRRTISLFALLLFSLTALVGCTTTGTNISVSQAKRLSYDFEIGQSEESIVEILGYPTETEVKTCGSSTDNPWDCRILTYTWVLEADSLLLYFQRGQFGWYLNSWSWY